MVVGDKVRVLPPFSASYPGERIIEREETTADGCRALFIEGVEGGFAECFLEVVDGA